MQVEGDIEELGVRLIWVLEADRFATPGTASSCNDFVTSKGSVRGICVGDAQTEPVAGTFDRSPLSIGRGFDILLAREDMRIIYQTTHGTPGGNENISAAQLLQEITDALP